MTLFNKMKGLLGDSAGGHGHKGISCADALKLVSEFIDGELENVSPQVVRAHFDACRACYPHLTIEQAFRDAMKRACCQEKAPAELRERLAELIAKAGSED
jgi:anti-sigma factor (TIGR02949 family)